MDESDWDSVLRNCCLLYGWKVDKRTSSIVRATTPAFRLKNKLPRRPVVAPPPPALPQQGTTPETPANTSVALSSNAPKAPETSKDVAAEAVATGGAVETQTPPIEDDVKAVAATEKPLTAEDVEAPIPTKLGAIPSYSINDRSRTEITMVSNEFQESMARNHFGASSLEGSA